MPPYCPGILQPTHGGPADTHVTEWIQNRANSLLKAGNLGVKRMPYQWALRAFTTHEQDFVLPYARDLDSVVDMVAIRQAGVKLAVDPLGGVALP